MVACYFVENKINVISHKDGLYIVEYISDSRQSKKRLGKEITFNNRIKILDAGLDSDSQ